jgi:iron complex transport system substrate-binding protein
MNAALEAMLCAAPIFPKRIVCLTEETTETLYTIGRGDLVVGVSGFTVRPPEARKKPKVSSFLDANFEKILELKPDLVLGFSDLQASLGAELAKRGVPVYLFNQRSIAEVLQSIQVLCALVGETQAGAKLVERLTDNVKRAAELGATFPCRPRVFFEEWHEPLISAIRWCSELIEVAGGDDVCAQTRSEQGARGRIVSAEKIVALNPDVVIGSWCGRKVKREKIIARPGWQAIKAVDDDQLYEIKSAYILQPGVAALSDGLQQLSRIIGAVSRGERLPSPRPGDVRSALMAHP